MSIENEIQKLQLNLGNCYTNVANKSGIIPIDQNFDNLSAAINSIVSGQEVEALISLQIDAINGESI